MTLFLILFALLGPPGFIVLHTLIGVLLMPFYGIDQIRWSQGAIEVIAKKSKDGKTRIWFQPGAQTWGLIIFYSSARGWGNAGLRVHERVHILQTYLFGVVYPVTYLLFFGVLFVVIRDFWKAYRKIPWEIWAYSKQDKFNEGKLPGAWGSKKVA